MKHLIAARCLAAFCVSIFFLNAGRAPAAPPRPGELEAARADGTLAKRQAFARENGNDQYDPDLIARARYDIERMVLEEQKNYGELDAMAPPPAWRGMPTTGTNKVLCVLVEFNDWLHNPANTPAMITDALFGDGIASNAPYESLQKYYQRSSYNKLTLTGNVLGWYKKNANRSSITQSAAGREALIKEVLDYYDGQGHNFAQYDNNNDGKIDLIYVVYAGPDNGWNNFWWAYQTNWKDGTYKKDGKTFGKYVFQFQNYNINTPFTPLVIIHETGHALGLPDLYDYDGSMGPDGGVGGLDMMDGNKGDHNCFSKWLLGWLTPTFHGSGSTNRSLRATGTTEDCVMIVPGAASNKQFSEFFMVQNRTKVGNDNASDWPGAGMMIWHVNSALDGAGQNYVADNSYTSNKLLKLMEADGLSEISSNNGGDGDAGDYYALGKAFTATGNPNSRNYDNSDSKVEVTNFTAAGSVMKAQFTITGAGIRPTVGIYAPSEGAAFNQGATIPITALATDNGTIAGVGFFADGNLIGWDYTAPFTMDYLNAPVGNRRLTVIAVDNTDLTTTSDIVTVKVNALSPPVNDNFANRITISGNPATVTGTNVSASAQASEPDHAGHDADNSVWWTWTPPITGTATITTTGSNYDTLLAAYTGTVLASLSKAASNDDANGTHQSSIIFGVTGGVPVQIAVDGYNGAAGTITLNVSVVFTPPPNDNFANATLISNLNPQVTVTGTTNGATAQSGEPQHGGSGALFGPFSSAWWKWTAPSTGSLDISTAGSTFDTTLSVHTGAAVNALTLRAQNDDTVGTSSAVSLPVTAGTVYYIAVDGFNHAAGDVSLQLYFHDVNDPPAITMSNPFDGESIGLNTAMQISTEAYDPEGHIKEVRFYLNGTLVNTVASHPENVSYDIQQQMTQPGYYTIMATAEDTEGLTGSTSATVLVGGITLAEALDSPEQIWLSGGPQSWAGSAANAHDGTDCAVSGAIAHLQQTWFRANVSGPGNISFWWKVSSELNYDYLTFYIDGVAQPGKISGETAWAHPNFDIPFGNHTLKWEYSKDINNSAGLDTAWVDQVVWITPPVLSGLTSVSGPVGVPFSYALSADVAISNYSVQLGSLPPGLTLNARSGVVSGTPTLAGTYNVTLQGTNAAGSDTLAVTFIITPSLPIPVSVESPRLWPTGGNSIWYGQAAVSHDTVDAAQSGNILDSQSVWTECSVAGPGILTFWCKVSSETNYDFLRFTIDADEQAAAPGISGNVDWVQRTVAVPAGNHALRWTYSKDGSVSAGTDAAWVDQVVFLPSLPQALDTPALGYTNSSSSGNAGWFGQILVTHDGVDAAQSGPVTHSQSTTTETSVTGPGSLSFWWKVSSESGFDFLQFFLDGVEQAAVVKISGEVDWQLKTVAIPAGSHTLRWRYTKDGSQSAGADAGWVDQVVFNSFNFTAPGTTAGRPLWNRPDHGVPPTVLSTRGTAVPYDVMRFTVSTTGSYTLKSTSLNPAGWDNFTLLYSNAFNPAAPMANVIAGNDDLGAVGVSCFTTTLTAGTNYYFVISGCDNTHAGSHTINITGAGSVTVTLDVSSVTTGRPVWHRPDAHNGNPPTALANAATAVPYDVVCFTVSATADYQMKSTGAASWDNYLFLYAGDFNPANPLNNVVTANDDFPSPGVAGFTATLTAGVTYLLVTSGFQNAYSGAYALEVTGPGRPQATSALDNWRLTWFGTKANSGLTADGGDYDSDGISNFAEFAFGLNPTQSSAGLLPEWGKVGGNFTLTFSHPAGVTGVTYRAEWSTTLLTGSWTVIPDTGVAPQHTFSIPAGANQRLFLRLTPSTP